MTDTKPRKRTPAFIKALSRGRFVRWLICWIGASYIRLVYATSRWRVVGAEAPCAYWDRGEPFILAFWHNRLLMMPYCWRRGQAMNMLISNHKDGELIAGTIAHFDLGAVRGSAGDAGKGGDKLSNKGGMQALRAMARAAAAGEAIGITPDGPRGPRMHASDGVAALARLTKLPVIPCAYSTSRRRVLRSWDKFLLALPFSQGVFVWGQPIYVEASKDPGALEAARAEIEAELNRVSAEADRLVGQSAIDPAPVQETAGAGGNRQAATA